MTVDGATRDDGCGGVLRSPSGKWIVGFNKMLGVSDSLSAEILGIIIGLNLAWERGFKQIYLESDSRKAMEHFRKGCSSSLRWRL